jgi:hypothetical protein
MNQVLKRLHYPLDTMLTCVRWCVAYPLSLRTRTYVGCALLVFIMGCVEASHR